MDRNELGQLVITGISGTVLTDAEKEAFEKENFGGVILFAYNYDNPAQLAELVNSIQQYRKDFPLFISADNEGGRVFRFKSRFTQVPPMLDIGRLGSPKICFEVHKMMAEELTACGVNVNFSPCADIFSNRENKVIGDRAFGRTEADVSKFVTSAIRGMQTNHLIACAKHFPGHGDTVKDSHHDLPIIKTPMATLKKRELQAFNKCVKSKVEMIMMAHIMVDVIDEEFPASMSEKAHKILRDDLRYKGIIITDDLKMKAVHGRYSEEVIIEKAMNAGTDILLYRDIEHATEGLNILRELVKTKQISMDSVSEKLKRVIDVKKRYLSDYKPVYIPDIEKKVGTKSNQMLMSSIVEQINSLSTENDSK